MALYASSPRAHPRRVRHVRRQSIGDAHPTSLKWLLPGQERIIPAIHITPADSSRHAGMQDALDAPVKGIKGAIVTERLINDADLSTAASKLPPLTRADSLDLSTYKSRRLPGATRTPPKHSVFARLRKGCLQWGRRCCASNASSTTSSSVDNSDHCSIADEEASFMVLNPAYAGTASVHHVLGTRALVKC
ncbi:hypothetical protein LTR85_008613 [Meristemomyces frigidus]|nr:hypothetical protein LTR85_008613 [Meristemomyces frigidus]